MKKIFLVAICIFLLVNLAACMAETPTGEPVAEVPSTAAPTESVSVDMSTSEPTTPDPTPIPPVIETPDGYDENGLPYYSVEENLEMIYDPYQFAGSYSGISVPSTSTADIILEMASDASTLNPDTLPIIRAQYYHYFDNTLGRSVYTPTTLSIKNNIKQKLVASNQITGLNIKENMIEDPEDYAEGSYILREKSGNISISSSIDRLSIILTNSNLFRTIEDAVDGETFLEEMENQQYIANLIEYAGFENPVCKRQLFYSRTGLSEVNYIIYDDTDDPVEKAFNLSFNYIVVGFNQSVPGRVSISLKQNNFNQNAMKMYNAISCGEAKQQLLQGNYFTNVPYEVEEEDIEYVDLTFITNFNQKYYVPAYRFYINTHNINSETNIESWGYYYVPAITGLDFQISDEGFQIG